VTARRSGGKLRVTFCHFTADVCGGADYCLYNMVKHLPRDRIEPSLILKEDDPMAETYRALGLDVVLLHLVPPRRAFEPVKLARYSGSFLPSVIQVARAIRRLDAEVVHVNTLYNLQCAIAARLAGRPLVWHIREMGSDSWLARVMLVCVSLLATRAVAMSQAIAGTLARCGPRLRMIYDGIELSRFDTPPEIERVRAELRLAPDAPAVTTIGRIEPWKGQHVLIEAAPRILEKHPNARILIVGGPAVNKPEYERGLRARCRELGIENSVLFTGIRQDIPDILAASSVLVLPSATPEPFGLTVVEAMAAGCPVVATAAGGPLETVLNGETGWLAPPNDPEAIAERVCRVLEHPGEAEKMGQRGRERARACFAVERYAREIADVFEEVARNP
jgi:glycosyltransferase involved in cell wall biosynthesis